VKLLFNYFERTPHNKLLTKESEKSEKLKFNVKKFIFHRNFATLFTMRMFGNSNNVNGNSILNMCQVAVAPPSPPGLAL
jgi:hypothetical protein